MANHASARTRVRRNGRRAVINKSRMSRIRTYLKSVEKAIEEGDAKTAQDALQNNVQPELYRGVSKGIVKKNAAARKMSRLSARIKALK